MSAESPSPLRIGLVTDLHFAEKDTRGSRHYRESLGKLKEATTAFTEAQVELVIELGDLIDEAADEATEAAWLRTIDAQFKQIPGQQHYVLGNHCVATLSKQAFLDAVGQAKSYYSFDAKGVHVVVLDACFREDETAYDRGNFHWQDCAIPQQERQWLRKDLAQTDLPVIVCCHQRIDETNVYTIKNAPAVRKILEQSGKVMAVFQGHSHKNEHQDINGIHYCTLTAMVEGSGPANNGYAVMTVDPRRGRIAIEGFRKQADYAWTTTD